MLAGGENGESRPERQQVVLESGGEMIAGKLKRMLQRKLGRSSSRIVNSFVPDYSVRSFAEFMQKMPKNGSKDAPSMGTTATTAMDCVAYFDSRTDRVLFHSREEMTALVGVYLRDHVEWCDRVVRRVVRDCSESSTLYSLSAPSLAPGYPWCGISPVPGNDLQFHIKPHRFSFLPRMAIAATNKPEVSEWMEEVLEDWAGFAASADGTLAFSSNLAVIQRLMACCWSWLILGAAREAEPAGQVRFMLLRIIRMDIRFLLPRLGGSHANNHLLADYFAGWFVCKLFPEFSQGDISGVGFEKMWLAELFRQTYPDGGSVEQSAHYHEFACDLALAYTLLCRANKWPLAPEIRQRLQNMLWFQSVLGGCHTVPCQIGDSIEDNFFPLGVHEGLGPALYLEAYRRLYDASRAASSPEVPATEAAFWLLGGLTPEIGEVDPGPDVTVDEFPGAGVVVVSDAVEDMDLVFRTGPVPGSEVLAGHAHADLLHVYLRQGAEWLLAPAGTFSYRSAPAQWPRNEPLWRHYFRGPDSGNGVVSGVGDPLGESPSGDFRSTATDTRVISRASSNSPNICWVEAEVLNAVGYRGYRRGLVHLPGQYTLVYDLHPRDGDLVRDSLQFGLGCKVSVEDKHVAAESENGSQLHAYFDTGARAVTLFTGSLDPLAGWLSPRYGEKLPAVQVRRGYRADTEVSCKLLSPRPLGVLALEIVLQEESIQVICDFSEFRDVFFLHGVPASEGRPGQELETDADCCWLRSSGATPMELRALRTSWIRLAGQLELRCQCTEEWVLVVFSSQGAVVTTASGEQPEIIRGRAQAE